MRILLVNLAKRFGGVDIRVRQTAQHLSPDHDIATVVIEGSPVHRELVALGLRTFPLRRRRWDPRIAADIARIAAAFRAEVIDTHNPQSQLWGLLAGLRVPGAARVVTVHTVYREAHRGLLRQRAHEAVLRLARRVGANFLTVSRSISGYLLRLQVPANRVRLSYNALEPLPADQPDAGLRAQLGLGAGDVLLAMLGRIEHVKGPDIFLESLEILRREGLSPAVAVIGTGSLEEQMKAQVQARGLSGQVHFLGFRRDIPALLEDIDILCMPSRSEGLPYTALEAARQGVPLVAAGVDGLREVFEDGATAVLVPPEDATAFARALSAMVRSGEDRKRIGDAAARMIAQDFAIPRMVRETLEHYELAIRSQKGRRSAG